MRSGFSRAAMKNPPDPFFRGPAATAVSAATVAGIALWISRASFDVAGTTAAPVRVAMLPSPAELMGFIVMALLIAAGLAASRRNSEQSFWGAATEPLLPLFALLLLVLPYLPWLSDWIPAVRLLAGPGRFLIWVVVLGQVLWILLPQFSPSKAATIFGVAAVAFSAPFVLNVPRLPTALVDAFQTVRHLPSANWSMVPSGSLGVLFDQEFGIFAFAPVLLLAFVGLAGMLREPSHRRLAIALAVGSLVLIVLPGTLDPWWSKSAMPGQHLLFLLPLLVVPIAWLYGRLPAQSLSRAGAQVLLLFSIAITLAILRGLAPVRQEADGSSVLLQWMSPTWNLWNEAPSYVESGAGAATVRVAVWLAVCGIAAWLVSRQKPSSAGRAAVAATAIVTLLFVAIASATSVAMSDSAQRFDVERRVLFNLLETFDPVARPIAIRYDPLSFVGPAELPALFTASAVPGERKDPQPIRVVLNARLRLPAGKYVLDLRGSDKASSVPDASMGLQIGREGRPIESWPLVLRPGERTEREFEVPLDAEFVGFRALRQVEPGIAELRVSPREVIETRKRFPGGTVLSAAAYPPARMFFHDSYVYPEAEGFWVGGRSIARMTMLKVRESDSGILLAVHSGARPNVVTLSTPGWSETLELVPGLTQRVTVPSKEGERFIPLTISSTDGFVPAEIEQSRDRRLLGAWLAFIPGDIARTSATP
jgi:hypothetical protein